MSNNDEWVKLWANLTVKYPMESLMVRNFYNKITEIHREIVSNPDVNPDSWKEIKFFITKKEGGHDYTLVCNQDGIVFLAAIANVFAKNVMETVATVLGSNTFMSTLDERAKTAARDELSHIMPKLPGYQLYHNYFREHESLGNHTPAEIAGIKIEGENKWITVIQNATINEN